MIKERIPISGDLKSKVKQLMESAGWQESRSVDPVSYTHLDVYKRQAHWFENVIQDNILFGMDEITVDGFFEPYKDLLDGTIPYGLSLIHI